MLKVYHTKDADRHALKNLTMGIIGYGSQGRAQALNLHDSGIAPLVGLPPQEDLPPQKATPRVRQLLGNQDT